MEKEHQKAANFDEYIATFPAETQDNLREMRETIISNAPAAIEVISYGMPAFKFHGMLLYFGAYKNHIGLYPMASGILTFKDEITEYKNSKGAIQFPLDQPLPLNLIERIVKFRVDENLKKHLLKKK